MEKVELELGFVRTQGVHLAIKESMGDSLIAGGLGCEGPHGLLGPFYLGDLAFWSQSWSASIY